MPPLLQPFVFAFTCLLMVFTPGAQGAEETAEPAKPSSRAVRQVEGWTVRVDDRLLSGEEKQQELGERALALLTAKLAEIQLIVAPDRVAVLQRVPIVLDLTHGSLKSMQYHPSVEWLVNNGFAPELAKCVHIPLAGQFASARHQHVQPWCVMHELAHAYHDQVLAFNNAKVKEVWQRYVESGHGVRALHVDGRQVRHYAMTNEKEFFAEMTEAYLGTNDFYPFVHAELKEAEPETFALLREIWGAPNY